MSIPSTDHTIYSFITLCLKEQGDIAGRKEITTKRMGGWRKKKVECHHRQRHISVTGLWLKSRAWGWTTKKHGCPTPPSHYPQTAAHAPLWRQQNLISDLSPDNQIYSAVQLPPCHPATTPSWRSQGGLTKGEGWSEGRQTVKGRRSTFSPQSHEFLWTGQMLPHIFWLHWQVAYCFPW